MTGSHATSDAQLLKQSSRDASAFAEFYDRHVAAIGAYFLRRTADHSLAADLTSETFAQAFAARRRYRKTNQPAAAWLYTIAVRQLNEFHRTQRVSRTYRHRIGVPIANTDAPFDRVDDLHALQDRLPKLQRAMDQLTSASAEAVMLRIGHQWTYQQLGAHLGCTPATARVRVSRALAQLESHLVET